MKNLPSAQILAAMEEMHRDGAPTSSQIARLLVQTFEKASARDDAAPQLTPREEEVLGLAAKRYRSKEIADNILAHRPIPWTDAFRESEDLAALHTEK